MVYYTIRFMKFFTKKKKTKSKPVSHELCKKDEWKYEECLMKVNDNTATEIANLVLGNNQYLIKQSRGRNVKVIYKKSTKPKEYQSITMARGVETVDKGKEEIETEQIINKLTELDNAGNDKAGSYLVSILRNNIQFVKPLQGGRRTKRRRAKRRRTKRRTSRKRITRRGGSLKRKNRRRRRTLKRRRRRN